MTDADHYDTVRAASLRTCPCRRDLTLRHVVGTDFARCRMLAARDGGPGVLSLARAFLFYPGLYGVVAYRLAHAALHLRGPRPVATVVYLAALMLQRAVILVTKVEISAQAHIGPGLLVNHALGSVIGAVVAGGNTTVSHNATLGRGGPARGGGRHGTHTRGDEPVLGDRVWIGIGAVVTGGLVLEDDVMVGANAVVRRDAPARAVVVGVPARTVSRQGSFEFVLYPGMDEDRSRARSLQAAGGG